MAFASTIHLPPSKPMTPSLQTEFNQGGSLIPDIEPSQDRPLGPSTAILKPSSSSPLQMHSLSSVITACSQSMKEVNPQSSPLIPPVFSLPPMPQFMWSVVPHTRSYSDSTSFLIPKSQKSSIETFKINAPSVQMLPTFPPDIHVRSDITVQDEQWESFSTCKNTSFSSPEVHSTPK
ncbi:hypothetical protein BS47DRAFT_1399866 [Hydnum rufescens UP504]|uniref:Uncharacterized protein n=1 Tax=Hydnum rufescens UP504 TaxID=1448309 RepID=A0A9P6DLN4_9AGAM|nr:hypothetical protein BS47DRAFT_1399866 [Hydnum rufescens UP504]